MQKWAPSSPTAFYKLMGRLRAAGFVVPQHSTTAARGRTIRECCYQVTDIGVLMWNATQAFYAGFSPAGRELETVVTGETKYAAYGRKKRRQLIKKKFARKLKKITGSPQFLQGLRATLKKQRPS